MIYDYDDRIMSFLGNSELEEIVKIASNPQELKAYLSRKRSSSEPEQLEPDTWEAKESAEAEFQRDDRAEEMIYRLLRQSPETWATIKTVMHQLAPKSDIVAFLERYYLEEAWTCPTYYTDPPEYQAQSANTPK